MHTYHRHRKKRLAQITKENGDKMNLRSVPKPFFFSFFLSRQPETAGNSALEITALKIHSNSTKRFITLGSKGNHSKFRLTVI